MGPSAIGIDPSLSSTGIAYPGGPLVVAGGPAELGDERLYRIYTEVLAACAGPGGPQLAVVEDLPKHAQSAGLTGMVQGVVRLALLQSMVPYVLVVPSTLKKYATGNGNATKSDMRMALFQRTGIDERNEDKVDAWWLRAMGMAWLGCPPVELPAAQRTALNVPQWPVIVP